MSDSSAFGFGKFIPGFDFLQNIGKAGTPSSGLPPFSHWVAPTVSIEEIEKRIEELKAVQFWIEQNGKALAATVQALEVQKMTLSTLKGMNVDLSEMAQAFPFAAAATAATSPAKTESNLSDWPMSAAAKTSEPPASAAKAKPTQAVPEVEVPAQKQDAAQEQIFASSEAQKAHMATAMQWWGALTQQFQQIAQQAMQDPAQQQAVLKATQMSTEFAKTAVKTASDMVRQAVAKTKPAKATPSAATKAPASTKAATVKQPATKRTAGAKKSTSPDKKATSTAAKAAGIAAKKSTVSKARSR